MLAIGYIDSILPICFYILNSFRFFIVKPNKKDI